MRNLVLVVPAVLGLMESLFAQVTWRKSEYLGTHVGVRMTTLGPSGGVLLCCGFKPFETWQWNGLTKTWTRRTTATVPTGTLPGTGLFHSALAYDSVRNRVVLHGGSHRAGGAPGVSNLTWEWDGLDWVQCLPTTVGPFTDGEAAAFHAATQRTVMRLLPDTWQWNGVNWTVASLPGPAARYHYTIADDPVRQRVMLFGGEDDNGVLRNETWEWDGNAWLQRTPPTSPSARRWSASTFDFARNRIVLFGGRDSTGNRTDTWEWDGSNWQQVLTSTSPPSGSSSSAARPAIAFESASARCVLRLGTDDPMGSSTWEFDGVDWTMVQAPTCPPGADIVYDTVRQQLLAVDTGPAQLWTWDGTRWAALPVSSPAPSPRGAAFVGFDSSRGRLVLFGGMAGPWPFTPLGDTWEWDGTNWIQLSAPVSPSPRGWGTLAWDGVRNRLVLLGGATNSTRFFDLWAWDGATWTSLGTWPGSQQSFNDWWGVAHDARRDRLVAVAHFFTQPWSTQTWEWDGQAWNQRFPANALCAGSGSSSHRLVYDAFRGRCVSVGYCAQTTEWDGTNWIVRTPLAAPADNIRIPFVAYDADRGEVRVWGGVLDQSPNYDVWSYGPTHPAAYTPFGTGCAGSAGVPALALLPTQLPWLGDTVTRKVSPIPNGAPAILLVGLQTSSWSGTPLPLALASVGAPGCSLLVSADVALLMTTTGTAATQGFSVPNLPALLGAQIHDQAVALDPGANALGATFSNGASLTAGGR